MTSHDTTRTALITGAGSGIGFAVAEAFLGGGDNVVINGRDRTRLEAAAARLGHRDRVDVLVNNAAD